MSDRTGTTSHHNIDLLAMLQVTTKGNLTADEQRVLDNSLTGLRFRFVQVQGTRGRIEA
jgi:hypothetical protein